MGYQKIAQRNPKTGVQQKFKKFIWGKSCMQIKVFGLMRVPLGIRDAELEPEPEPEPPEPTDFGRSRSRSRSRRNGLLGAGAGAGAVKNGAAPAPKRGTIVARKNKPKAK